jgi:hypothetical protein
MLAVTRLALEILEKQQVPPHQLQNVGHGPKAFVVTGPAHSVYDLVTSLHKI